MRRALAAAAVLLALASCDLRSEAQKQCEARGGKWVVTGEHRELSYIHHGRHSSIPFYRTVADHGCREA